MCTCCVCVSRRRSNDCLRNIITRRGKPRWTKVFAHTRWKIADTLNCLNFARRNRATMAKRLASLRTVKRLYSAELWVRFFLPKTFSLGIVQQVVVEKLYWNFSNTPKITEEHFLTIVEDFPHTLTPWTLPYDFSLASLPSLERQTFKKSSKLSKMTREKLWRCKI